MHRCASPAVFAVVLLLFVVVLLLFTVVLLLFVVVVMMMIVVGLLLLFLFASRVVGAIRCCQVLFASPWSDYDSICFACCFTWRFA